MVIYDAHAHPGSAEERRIRKEQQVRTFLCATDPESASLVAEQCHNEEMLIPVYGLHPWYADRYQVAQLAPYIKTGRMLGEIGMDRTWCQVDIKRQREMLNEQLALAEYLSMPVILHTKGAEQEVLECIKMFRLPILVHWYSADRYLDGYLEKNCFFSIGPDVLENPAVQQVVKKAGIDRLLVETDGMEAVRWVCREYRKEEVQNRKLSEILLQTIDYIGLIKGMSRSETGKYLEKNFRFLADYYQGGRIGKEGNKRFRSQKK